MKEDVEPNLPTKEELIVWVHMTPQQHGYYVALYAGSIGELLGVYGPNIPQMKNLAMELRKLCCHPVGLSSEVSQRARSARIASSWMFSFAGASGQP